MHPDDLTRLRAALGDRYELRDELGRGGMAVVLRARDLKHDRTVAVKVLRPDLARALGPERFLREIKLTAGLSHPHILPLYDSGRTPEDPPDGRTDALLYYVMPYVQGESLRDRLDREGRLPLEEALRITREVADGLASAHRHGVIHRDIKPDNILLAEGHALIADFGVARAVAEAADDARLTATGLAIGTPVYMSPEQVTGERALDGRADIYALGCVLYEMLAGEPPFSGPTVEAAIARRFTDPVPYVTAVREGVPGHVERAIRRALHESPGKRFATADHFAEALAVPDWTTPATGLDLRAVVALVRRPKVAIPLVALVLAIGAALLYALGERAAERRAEALLPEIAELVEQERWAAAYALAVEAEDALGGDTVLAGLMRRVADRFTITSEPAGATVWLRRFAPDGAHPDSVRLGETPIEDHRIARGDYRVTVYRDGYAPQARMASSAEERTLTMVDTAGTVALRVRLLPEDAVPDGMVFVPGGAYSVLNPDAPVDLGTDLEDFFIDRFEVTNARYAAFIRDGGYGTPAHWAGLELSPAARAALRDQTGMPAPRRWVSQTVPAGKDDHPVTGVTWYEATAYCASRGRRLPSVFEWDKAARDGRLARTGILMPWGFGETAQSRHRANYSSTGTEPVDAYPFGVSPYGAWAMAGNVKEWVANPMGEGRMVTGGSWEDPPYVYSELGALPPDHAAPTVGFRCAQTAGDGSGDQGASRAITTGETPVYRPVDREGFRALLAHYRYDPRPLAPAVVETIETPDWIRLLVRYVATEQDTAAAYLYLPHRAEPPYQTIVYVSSSAAFVNPVWAEVEWLLDAHIRGGRAVFALVLKGMTGRPWPPGWTPPAPPSVRFRDLMVLHATEVRRGIDYLETRDDIDTDRLAYAGLSFGAGSRLLFAAVDDRYDAVVFIGGGIDERVQPTLPEAANVNFAPYLDAPVLLVNGAHDEEHPWRTRALPLWNLLSEPKELVLVDGAGHVPPPESRVPAINAFLDRVLGPVGER